MVLGELVEPAQVAGRLGSSPGCSVRGSASGQEIRFVRVSWSSFFVDVIRVERVADGLGHLGWWSFLELKVEDFAYLVRRCNLHMQEKY